MMHQFYPSHFKQQDQAHQRPCGENSRQNCPCLVQLISQMTCLMDKRRLQFIPEKWQQGIGQICSSCHSKLTPSDCLSLCQCYLFCHEACFLRQFGPYIADRQEIKCMRCQQEVVLDTPYIYKWQCMRKPIRIVPIAVGFVILLVMFILTASGVYRSGLSDGAAYGIFSAMTVVLLVSMLLSMRRKYIDLAGVRVSKANRPGSESHLARMRNDYENDLKRQDRIELATSSDKDFVIQ